MKEYKTEILVTTELCAEDRARLDRLIAALENVGTPYNAPAPKPEAVVTRSKPEAKAPEAPKPKPEKPTEETKAPKATRDAIRAKVVTLIQTGKKKETGAIIKAYAPGVPDLPDEVLDEVMAKLTALEKEVKQ